MHRIEPNKSLIVSLPRPLANAPEIENRLALSSLNQPTLTLSVEKIIWDYHQEINRKKDPNKNPIVHAVVDTEILCGYLENIVLPVANKFLANQPQEQKKCLAEGTTYQQLLKTTLDQITQLPTFIRTEFNTTKMDEKTLAMLIHQLQLFVYSFLNTASESLNNLMLSCPPALIEDLDDLWKNIIRVANKVDEIIMHSTLKDNPKITPVRETIRFSNLIYLYFVGLNYYKRDGSPEAIFSLLNKFMFNYPSYRDIIFSSSRAKADPTRYVMIAFFAFIALKNNAIETTETIAKDLLMFLDSSAIDNESKANLVCAMHMDTKQNLFQEIASHYYKKGDYAKAAYWFDQAIKLVLPLKAMEASKLAASVNAKKGAKDVTSEISKQSKQQRDALIERLTVLANLSKEKAEKVKEEEKKETTQEPSTVSSFDPREKAETEKVEVEKETTQEPSTASATDSLVKDIKSATVQDSTVIDKQPIAEITAPAFDGHPGTDYQSMSTIVNAEDSPAPTPPPDPPFTMKPAQEQNSNSKSTLFLKAYPQPERKKTKHGEKLNANKGNIDEDEVKSEEKDEDITSHFNSNSKDRLGNKYFPDIKAPIYPIYTTHLTGQRVANYGFFVPKSEMKLQHDVSKKSFTDEIYENNKKILREKSEVIKKGSGMRLVSKNGNTFFQTGVYGATNELGADIRVRGYKVGRTQNENGDYVDLWAFKEVFTHKSEKKSKGKKT